MTIWDMDTVNKVSRLWVEVVLDDSVVFADPDGAHAAMSARLTARLVAEALTFGVDVHPGDVRTQSERADEPFKTRFMAAWRPPTTSVELVGGESDGRVVEFPRVGDTFLAPRRPSLSAVIGPPSTVPTIDVDRYELDGWRETERRWVYRIAP